MGRWASKCRACYLPQASEYGGLHALVAEIWAVGDDAIRYGLAGAEAAGPCSIMIGRSWSEHRSRAHPPSQEMQLSAPVGSRSELASNSCHPCRRQLVHGSIRSRTHCRHHTNRLEPQPYRQR